MEGDTIFRTKDGILYIERGEISEENGECQKIKVIRGSGNTIHASHKIITGNGNNIHGNGNTVRGNYNTLYGVYNEAIGHGNTKEIEQRPLRRKRENNSSESRTTYHAYGDPGMMFSILSSVFSNPFPFGDRISREPEPKRPKLLIPDEQEEEEDASLEEKDACTICKVKRKTVTIVDCGHTMFCVECMRRLLTDSSQNRHRCPICSKEIVYGAQKLRLYE